MKNKNIIDSQLTDRFCGDCGTMPVVVPEPVYNRYKKIAMRRLPCGAFVFRLSGTLHLLIPHPITIQKNETLKNKAA